MSSKTTLHRALMAAAGISTALCLSACGGSSKSTGQATSTAAAQASSATQSSSSSSTSTAATATRSLSPRAQAQANRAALVSFTACLRKHGIHVPPQDLSSTKLKFDTKGLDTSSARYQRIGAACLSAITAAYRSATADGG